MARKCRHCKTELPKAKDCTDPFQKNGFCDVDCMSKHGLNKARQQKERAEKKEIKQRKEKLKTKHDHTREAQKEFNRFIRLRDSSQPCISCGKNPNDNNLITGSRWDAGHYRSVGSCPELRFEELNCHKQCVKCNRDLSGNAIEYRINLKDRIGSDKLDWLEGPHEQKKYTIEELKEIKVKYREKANFLAKQLELI